MFDMTVSVSDDCEERVQEINVFPSSFLKYCIKLMYSIRQFRRANVN